MGLELMVEDIHLQGKKYKEDNVLTSYSSRNWGWKRQENWSI